MTKQNPDKLCPSCEEFDYMMNRQGGVSLDVFVVCEHDEAPESAASPSQDVHQDTSK